MLTKMIIHAKKKETEQQIYPFWLVHVVKSAIDKTEIVPIEDMLKGIYDDKTDTRTADDILNELMPLIEADKKKAGEVNG